MTPEVPSGRLEVRDQSGQVVGYFVPSAEFQRLQNELGQLKAEVGELKADAIGHPRPDDDPFKPLPPLTDAEADALLAGPLIPFGQVIDEIRALADGHR